MAKIGEGHAAAMGRKGLSELAQYLPAFNQAGQSIIEDQGAWPNKTAGEIANARDGPGDGAEQERKFTLAEFIPYAADLVKQRENETGLEQSKEIERGDLKMIIRLLIASTAVIAMTSFVEGQPSLTLAPRSDSGLNLVFQGGDNAGAFVAEYGEDASNALFACIYPVPVHLANLHASGVLKRMPDPRRLLRLIACSPWPNDIAMYVVIHGEELTNPDAFNVFLFQPHEFLFNGRQLSDAVADVQRERWIPFGMNLWFSQYKGVLTVLGMLLCIAWYRRRYRARDSPA